MTPETRSALIEYFNGFVTENKRNSFERVLARRTRHLTIILEDIHQPHNASAVMRSADCFGIQDIHVIENRNRFTLNPNVSAGASKWITLHRYNQRNTDNLARCVESLRRSGYRIIAATPHENVVLVHDLSIEQPLAIAFGTEHTGLSPELIGAADGFVKVPMFGFTESFNLSVSVGLVFYDLTLRLHRSGIGWGLSDEEKTELRLTWLRKVLARHKGLEERFLKEHGLA